jgi:hypothetical protein
VPVFVALLVLLARVLIIGSFSLSGSRLFSQGDARTALLRPATRRTSAEAGGEGNPLGVRPVASAPAASRAPIVQRMSARPNHSPQ